MIVAKRQRPASDIVGLLFNTYFADDMSVLTSASSAPSLESQIRDVSIRNTNTLVFRGYFIPDTTSTTYTFRTRSDDASYFWIGDGARGAITDLDVDNATVDNGGLHGARTVVSGNISLTAGQLYPIALVAGNNTGPGIITLSWATDGSSYTSDGSGNFFHNPKSFDGYSV